MHPIHLLHLAGGIIIYYYVYLAAERTGRRDWLLNKCPWWRLPRRWVRLVSCCCCLCVSLERKLIVFCPPGRRGRGGRRFRQTFRFR